MPIYEYFCEANNTAVEVDHSIKLDIKTWGQLCETAGIDPGDTSAEAPVKRLLFTPGIATPKTNSELKDLGFTKLVKRDDGVYENVTRSGDESRYMERDKPETMPHVHKKVGD
mgnify:CR=1 FL=1